jgi:integrase
MADRLNDRFINSLKPPAKGKAIHWDDLVKGFGLRITSGGAKSFILNYRNADGSDRQCTIGSFPDWTTAAAREQAKSLKRDIDGGADPVSEQRSTRNAETVNDLLKRFEDEYLPRKRASTQATYRNQIKSVVRPKLGKLKVAAVSFSDIDKLHHGLRATPYRANRIVSLVSRIFTMSIKWKMRTDNPAKGIERNNEDARERYLSMDELVRLSAALDGFHDQQTANIIRLLLLCGARVGEVVKARWVDIDLNERRWTKPSAHTKQGKVHVLPLSNAAIQLLQEIREDVPKDVPWVFPAADGNGHRSVIKAAWVTICETAGIENARVHDLRHTHASILINKGYSLPIIGKLLGHTVPSTTQRYAHLADDPLRRAVEDASATITGKKSAEIVRVSGRRHG